MLKELNFKKKVQKLDVIHIRQYLERQGFEFVSMKSDLAQDLSEMLKLDFTGEKALVYISSKLKYVFFNPSLNEEDLLYVLLHECGHIELNHKATSMKNETEAWNFAYNIKNIHKKITGIIYPVIFSIILTLAISTYIPGTKNNIPPNNQVEQTKAVNSSKDTVYITATGTKFHTKDCIYIKDKNYIPCVRSDAETVFHPCSVCIK